MQHKDEVKQWIVLADNDLALAEHTSLTKRSDMQVYNRKYFKSLFLPLRSPRFSASA